MQVIWLALRQDNEKKNSGWEPHLVVIVSINVCIYIYICLIIYIYIYYNYNYVLLSNVRIPHFDQHDIQQV